MVGSREESPDWLRTFQAPDRSTFTISSDSDSHSSYKASPINDCDVQSSVKGRGRDDRDSDEHNLNVLEEDGTDMNRGSRTKSDRRGRNADANNCSKKRKTFIVDDDEDEKESGEEASMDQSEPGRSTTATSSDSDYLPDSNSKGVKEMPDNLLRKKSDANDPVLDDKKSMSSPKVSSKKISVRKNFDGLVDPKDENAIDTETIKDTADDTNEKSSGCRVSTTLPLTLSDKVHRSKALVECEGDSIDLSGDMGAVGRVIISDNASQGNELQFDLKGTIYNTSVIPCRTFCVVSFGQSEAKIEAIMNDFIQLKPKSNVFDAETMVEGTLDGFSFESEDEADKFSKPLSNQPEQDDNEEKPKKRSKGKSGKPSGPAQNKTAGPKSRLPKKQKKRPQISKKSKIKK